MQIDINNPEIKLTRVTQGEVSLRFLSEHSMKLQRNELSQPLYEGLKCQSLYNFVFLSKSYLDKGLETFVFRQEVLVEVYSFIVAAAESSINPLHAFTIGSWELEQNLTEMNTQNNYR